MKKAPKQRGSGPYRAVYASLWDHPDFRALSERARLVFLACRLGPQATMACIFRLYPQVLAAQVGCTLSEVEAALTELAARPSRSRPWIVRDAEVLWVRNGLHFDPSAQVTNPKHLTAILTRLAALPRGSAVVRKFKQYYGIARDRVSDRVCDSPPRSIKSVSSLSNLSSLPNVSSLSKSTTATTATPPTPRVSDPRDTSLDEVLRESEARTEATTLAAAETECDPQIIEAKLPPTERQKRWEHFSGVWVTLPKRISRGEGSKTEAWHVWLRCGFTEADAEAMLRALDRTEPEDFYDSDGAPRLTAAEWLEAWPEAQERGLAHPLELFL